MQKIRKGDQVVVTTGKDKGKRGAVLRVVDTARVIVEGVNRVKRHTRPNPVKGQPGGILDKEMPIHISNIALFNPGTGKADRVGFRSLDDGRKVRFFKSNGEVTDA
jgi:large subunit ribosomal protein L24